MKRAFAVSIPVLMAITAMSWGDIVIQASGYSDGSGDAFTDGSTVFGQGVTFTASGSSAGSGKWALQSMKVQMQSSGTFNISNIDVSLYSVTGTNLTRLANGLRSFTGGNSIGATASDFTIDLAGFYGSTDSAPGIEAGLQYLLTWDVNGSGSAAWTLSLIHI